MKIKEKENEGESQVDRVCLKNLKEKILKLKQILKLQIDQQIKAQMDRERERNTMRERREKKRK